MKIRVCFFCALFASAFASHAAENPYDVLGKMLAPFVNLFAKETKNPNRAMSAEVSWMLEITGTSAEAVGEKLTFAIQWPDKLYLHGPVRSYDVFIWRNGEEISIFPKAVLEEMASEFTPLPKLDPKYKFGIIELPFPDKQIVFLPAFFQINDDQNETVNGVSCRALKVSLMPELARSLKLQEWSVRLWIQADYKLAKVELIRPGTRVLLDFQKIEFLHSLPASTWLPAPEQAPNVLHLDPPHFKQLLDAVARGLKLSL